MAQKLIILVDPGIDGAFAVALALHDPAIDLLGMGATAGNINAAQATKNVHILIEQMDPPRWPKLGAALPVSYDMDGTHLHGQNGLGNIDFPCSQLHNIQPSDKLLVDLVRMHPDEVTVLCLGPMSVLSAAMERDPDLPLLVKQLICLGGTVNEPGNYGPVSEFHFACDPLAVRHVLQSGAAITIIPLDLMREVVFSPADLLDLPAGNSKTCRFLKKIVPYGIGTTSNLYGIEGFHLKDVLGVVHVALSDVVTTKPMAVDIETQGELTRGMCVVDRRVGTKSRPNVEMGVDVDGQAVRQYIDRILRLTG